MTRHAGRARRLGTSFVPVGVSACALALVACTSGDAPKASASTSPSLPFVIPTPPLSTVETGDLANIRATPWDFAVRVDDRTLDVRYLGARNRCEVLANVRVNETSAQVTITLYTGTPPDHTADVCTNVGVPARTRVPLTSPIGERVVLDGATRPPEERAGRPH